MYKNWRYQCLKIFPYHIISWHYSITHSIHKLFWSIWESQISKFSSTMVKGRLWQKTVKRRAHSTAIGFIQGWKDSGKPGNPGKFREYFLVRENLENLEKSGNSIALKSLQPCYHVPPKQYRHVSLNIENGNFCCSLCSGIVPFFVKIGKNWSLFGPFFEKKWSLFGPLKGL